MQESEIDFDTILSVLENPIRRMMIKRLSQEPCYALQLSKELGLGQSLVAKHLEIMEDAGIIISSVEESPSGPNRKEYRLNNCLSFTISFGSNLYNTHVASFNRLSEKKEVVEELSPILDRIKEISEDTPINSIGLYAELLEKIDGKMNEVDEYRADLLFLRNLVMKNACKVMREADNTFDEKRVLHHILDQHDRDIQGISESLNMRERLIRDIIEELDEVLR